MPSCEQRGYGRGGPEAECSPPDVTADSPKTSKGRLLAEDRVEQLHEFLDALGLQVITLPTDTSTSQLAAEAIGTSVEKIAKSLLFVAESKPVLVIAAGHTRVDRLLLAAELGAEQVRLARLEEVLLFTGYPVGGVPPLRHATALEVVIDRHLLVHDTVFAAAGTSNTIVAIPTQMILELTGASVVDVCHA